MRILVGATPIGDHPAAAMLDAVVRGWKAAAADDLAVHPLSDGATGLVESLAATGGTGGTAVVETARLLTGTSTAPVGETFLAAVDSGADRVVLGMGRSRSHDGGWGFAEVVRGRYGSLAGARAALAGIELVVAGSEPLALLGLHGAGARLAGEMGPVEAQRRDREVAAFAAAVEAEVAPVDPVTGRRTRLSRSRWSGLGAGSGFVALALGARGTSGTEFTVAASGLADAVVSADLCVVVVAEMDSLALQWSAAAAVAPAALATGCPVVVLTGEDHTSRHQRAALGIVGSYATGGPLTPGSLAARVRGVARTFSR